MRIYTATTTNEEGLQITTVQSSFEELCDVLDCDDAVDMKDLIAYLEHKYGSKCPYTLSEGTYMACWYKDKGGVGGVLECENEDDAIATARTLWNHLTEKEQKAFLTDPAGYFVAKLQVYVPPQNGKQEHFDDTIFWDALMEMEMEVE